MSRMDIDTRDLEKALKAIDFKAGDLLDIEGAGAAVLINGMRMRVPVKTAATKNSIMSHIIEATDTTVINEVGPETTYAPNIEYGIKTKPNYPIQPFVRPTVIEDGSAVVRAVGKAFASILQSRWPK